MNEGSAAPGSSAAPRGTPPPNPATSPDDYEYVGFGPRLWASFIDTVLVLAVCMPLYSLVDRSAGGDVSLQSLDLTSFRLIDGPTDFLVNWALPAVAIVLFWVYRQATPGKIAIRASIVDARTGGVPTAGQLVIRYLGYYVSMLPLFVGFLWIAFDPRKQGWHDKLAHTVVVRPKQRGTARVQFGR